MEQGGPEKPELGHEHSLATLMVVLLVLLSPVIYDLAVWLQRLLTEG